MCTMYMYNDNLLIVQGIDYVYIFDYDLLILMEYIYNTWLMKT